MSNFNLCQLIFSDTVLRIKNGIKINTINFYPKNRAEIRDFLNNKSGIYFWFNILDGKIYIGSSTCLWRRFRCYINSFLKEDGKNNIKLKRAVKKYGLCNFKFGLIQILNNDKVLLKTIEQEILDQINPFDKNGYNISKSAWRPLNCKISKRGKLNIKKRHTGENSEMSKLTDENVRVIKEKLSEGKTLRELSVRFSVSTTVISNIKRGLSWSHIKMNDAIEKKLQISVSKNKRKFSKDFILKIKQDLKDGLRSIDIAKKYNLIYSTVHSIKNGHIYSYL